MYWKEHPFEYALKYVAIRPDNSVYFRPDTPKEIRERFTREWEAHMQDQAARRKEGDFSEW